MGSEMTQGEREMLLAIIKKASQAFEAIAKSSNDFDTKMKCMAAMSDMTISVSTVRSLMSAVRQ